jgi:hypothetical protein
VRLNPNGGGQRFCVRAKPEQQVHVCQPKRNPRAKRSENCRKSRKSCLSSSLQNSAITWAIQRARSAQRMKPISAMARQDGFNRRWHAANGYHRDRDGIFSPILITRHERRYTVFDDKIIAMYAGGKTVRENRAFLSEQYGADVSPDFISSLLGPHTKNLTTPDQLVSFGSPCSNREHLSPRGIPSPLPEPRCFRTRSQRHRQ